MIRLLQSLFKPSIYKGFLVTFFLIQITSSFAARLLIPMDESQVNHLKAYGAVYSALVKKYNIHMILNYRGGSFILSGIELLKIERDVFSSEYRDVSYQRISDSQYQSILKNMKNANTAQIYLKKIPRIGVYQPPAASPWDDAVVMALDYARIPYERVYDAEVLSGRLASYNWLHLHHEDFTGQLGKFYATSKDKLWYRKRRKKFQSNAEKLGFSSIPELKKAVALRIRDFTYNGGYLFAMCSAADTLDITLASLKYDIVDARIDGTPLEYRKTDPLNYSQTMAFENFHLITDPNIYEFSDIDIDIARVGILYEKDFFSLFNFNAQYDPIPAMLTQNHKKDIRGFLGQTSSFNRKFIKSRVIILGETRGTDRVKYIYGSYGRGFFSFYAGHDPEDYVHYVGDPKTDLELFKNSPGYRIILNNIFLPSVGKKKKKT